MFNPWAEIHFAAGIGPRACARVGAQEASCASDPLRVGRSVWSRTTVCLHIVQVLIYGVAKKRIANLQRATHHE
ncbi:MAG: hypothetical protein ACYDHX_01360 [Methanothrix sp.]